MKTKKRYQAISLINSNLLKYQTYTKDYLRKYEVENISSELKQALKIIYMYNKTNKKILFIGFPHNKFLFNQTKNTFMSKNLYKKLLTLDSQKVCRDYDLIVLSSFKTKDKIILKHLKSLDLPLILFGVFDTEFYSVKGFFENKKIKEFCLFLIFSVLVKIKNYDFYKKI